MSNPTPTTLREILIDFALELGVEGLVAEYKTKQIDTVGARHLDQTARQIKEQLKALLPMKLPNKSNEFSEAFIIGRNRTVDQIEKAIEEWAK